MPKVFKNPFKKDSQDYLKLDSLRETLAATKLTQADVTRMFKYPRHQVSAFFHGQKPVPIGLLKKLHKRFIRDGFFVEKDFDPRKVKQIEPGIKPLVKALNKTGILKTFSSCEAHFKKSEQTIDDRTCADVRFYKADVASEAEIELFVEYVLNEVRKADLPADFWGYKHYVPRLPPVYVLEIVPYNRLANAGIKRKHTDIGIAHITSVVKKAGRLLEKGQPLELEQ